MSIVVDAGRSWRRRSGRLVAMAVLGAVCATAAVGCKKKNDAVEAVDPAGKKPPVVGRKSREAAKAVDAPAPVTAAVAPGRRPAPPVAGASPPPAVAPVAPAAAPTAAAAPAAPTPMPAPAPELAALPPGTPPTPVPPTAMPPAESERARLPGRLAAVAPPAAPDAPPEAPHLGGEPADAPPARPMPTPSATSGEPALDVTGYLSLGDLERVLGAKAALRRADLLGTAPSPGYNYLYFNKGKGDDFGVAVQVWRDSNPAESRTRFATMKNTYSNVAPTNKVADQGFRAFFGGVVTLVFADPRRPMVAAVSCSTKTCTADQMLELSRRVAERLH